MPTVPQGAYEWDFDLSRSLEQPQVLRWQWYTILTGTNAEYLAPGSENFNQETDWGLNDDDFMAFDTRSQGCQISLQAKSRNALG
jgi:hypothetical protein